MQWFHLSIYNAMIRAQKLDTFHYNATYDQLCGFYWWNDNSRVLISSHIYYLQKQYHLRARVDARLRPPGSWSVPNEKYNWKVYVL